MNEKFKISQSKDFFTIPHPSLRGFISHDLCICIWECVLHGCICICKIVTSSHGKGNEPFPAYTSPRRLFWFTVQWFCHPRPYNHLSIHNICCAPFFVIIFISIKKISKPFVNEQEHSVCVCVALAESQKIWLLTI